ncbi:MAG: diadenylate cyclase CdaA [Oscillospiraceae bacterium]|nr:diadenylate cyclase CdaA [Oscillospiraceae bacterium]MDE6132526.1 diadenylate cyclase CdaA [Oscillospiraceae bacterium]
MDFLYELGSLINSTLPIEFWDVLDIAVLTVLIYKGVTLVKETRAGGLIRGIIFIFIAYVIMEAVGMNAMAYILKNVFSVGLVAVVVLFQPELRRSLEKMGHSRVSKLPVFSSLTADTADIMAQKWNTAIEAICDACEDLASTTTGALIVIEQESKLGEQIDTGTVLNALPSKEVFGNIFYPKTPLHDGAVIMRDGIILAAACFLPKPQKEETINKALGSRHRAAIGMSENSDAIIIVVSEETGTISVAENGELTRGYTRDSLKKLLRSRLLPEKNQKITRPPKSGKHSDNEGDSDDKENSGLFGLFHKKKFTDKI